MAVSHTVLGLLCHSALQCRVRAIDCIERLASECWLGHPTMRSHSLNSLLIIAIIAHQSL